MGFQWPGKVRLANLPTPIVQVPALTELAGARVFVKRDDLTECAASGNKIRKLEFLLAHAQAQGAEVVITAGGVQSNHCRATAVACRTLGLKPHLVLRGEEPDALEGNYFLNRLLGADITFVNASEYDQLDLVLASIEADYRDEGLRPYTIPVGGSNALGSMGYAGCAREIADFSRENSITFRRIYHAAGSGGTTAGLLVGAAAFDLDAEVVGINVGEDRAPFLAHIRDIVTQGAELAGVFLPWPWTEAPLRIVDGYAGEGYGHVSRDLARFVATVARTTGLILDPVYTGKALDGLVKEERRSAAGGDVLFVHTGGVFGLLGQKDDLKPL